MKEWKEIFTNEEGNAFKDFQTKKCKKQKQQQWSVNFPQTSQLLNRKLFTDFVCLFLSKMKQRILYKNWVETSTKTLKDNLEMIWSKECLVDLFVMNQTTKWQKYSFKINVHLFQTQRTLEPRKHRHMQANRHQRLLKRSL